MKREEPTIGWTMDFRSEREISPKLGRTATARRYCSILSLSKVQLIFGSHANPPHWAMVSRALPTSPSTFRDKL